MTTPTSPGWQPAPDGNGEQWWNGVDWSESRRGHSTAPAPSPAPAYGPPAPDTGHPGSPVYAPPVPSPYAQAQPQAPQFAPPVVNPYAPPATSTSASSLATTALVLGIVGMFVGLVGIAAIIVGFMARARVVQENALPKYRGYAMAGIVLGFVSLIGGFLSFMFLIFGFLPFSS